MELFLLLIQIPLLIFLIKYIRKKQSNPLLLNAYYYLLSFKITAGLLLGILYFNYYGGDTFNYLVYNDFLSQLFYSDFNKYIDVMMFKNLPPESTGEFGGLFYQARAFNFLRLTSPFYIFSGSNYWILSIYMSLFSFSGLWILSNTLLKLYKIKPLAIMVAFFVFPSFVFWSSGVMKESFILGIISYIISIVLQFIHEKKITVWNVIIFLFCSYNLLVMKFYYFAPLFAILIPYAIVKYFSNTNSYFLKKKENRILIMLLLIVVIGGATSFVSPFLNISTLSKQIYLNYNDIQARSSAGSNYSYDGLNEEPASFVKHIPKALSFGLFGPYLWQCKKIIAFIAGLENTVLLTLFITFLFYNLTRDKCLKIDIEVVAIVLYVLVLATILAFASPNWGSLVRYKVGYIPFFVLLILNSNPLTDQLEKRFSALSLTEKQS